MKNAFIIHGTYGNSRENWFPWLKSELEKIGYKVFVPDFPTPENQNLKSWLEVFNEYKKYIDSETVLIGHSVGAAFVLSILESLKLPVKAVFLVSGFLGLLNNSEFDNLNKEFTVKEFDWNKIKQNTRNIYLYHSDNDFYVPIEKAEELAIKLETNVDIIKNAGHFNGKAGYTKFDKLLLDINSLKY